MDGTKNNSNEIKAAQHKLLKIRVKYIKEKQIPAFEKMFDMIKTFLAEEVDNNIKFPFLTSIYYELLTTMFKFFDEALKEAEKKININVSGYEDNSQLEREMATIFVNTPNPDTTTPNPATARAASLPTTVGIDPSAAAIDTAAIAKRVEEQMHSEQWQDFQRKLADAALAQKKADNEQEQLTSGYLANNEIEPNNATETKKPTVGGKRKINKSKRNKSSRNKIAKKTRKH